MSIPMLRRIRHPVILLALLFCLTEVVGYAQERPPWKIADMIRDRMFKAQADILAADQNDADVAAASIPVIDAAQAQYHEELQPEYGAFAPAADQAIQEAFAVARSATLAGDAPGLAAAAGRLQTAILWGSKEVTLDAVARGEMARAAEWLRCRPRPGSHRAIGSDFCRNRPHYGYPGRGCAGRGTSR